MRQRVTKKVGEGDENNEKENVNNGLSYKGEDNAMKEIDNRKW